MQSMSAKDAKYGFGRLIDLARPDPIVVEKHGRPLVVLLSAEEFGRLKLWTAHRSLWRQGVAEPMRMGGAQTSNMGSAAVPNSSSTMTTRSTSRPDN